MFTRYNSIRVPSNYGGTRFTEDGLDSNMKIHKGGKEIDKISISDSFQKSQDIEIPITSPDISIDDEVLPPIEDVYIEKAPLDNKEAHNNILKDLKSSLGGLFNNLAKDDLLLIGLILLLSDKGGEDTFSIILLLSILLISK